jgi:hypothetical protein
VADENTSIGNAHGLQPIGSILQKV